MELSGQLLLKSGLDVSARIGMFVNVSVNGSKGNYESGVLN